jgi:TRAP-type C4-dicarboxylate transport system permease small subunit
VTAPGRGDVLARIVAGWAVAGGLVLLAIVLVTGVNVGLYAIDAVAPGRVTVLSGYEELVKLLISAAALMMLPYCQLRNGHVAVDLFTERLPPRAVRVIELVNLVLMAAIVLFLAGWMSIGMLETRADGRVSPVLNWAEWPYYLPGIVSLLLWALVSLALFRATLRGERR